MISLTHLALDEFTAVSKGVSLSIVPAMLTSAPVKIKQKSHYNISMYTEKTIKKLY